MAALNFPNAPTIGQVFGAYSWDGEKWAARPAGVSIPDAALDGTQYGRLNGGWTPIAGSSFIQAGSGAVSRTMQDKVREGVSVKDFGALGNGVANDTAAFLAAIAYLESVGGGRLFIPRGTYNIAATLAPTKPIRFVGESWGYSVSDFAAMHASTVTRLKWTGGHNAFFQFQNLWFGWGISGMDIDCSYSAYAAVYIDSCCGGTLEQVSAVNLFDFGLLMLALQNTCSWNHFCQTNWEGTGAGNSCIDIDRNIYANTCHNTFVNTRVTHGSSRHGIYLGACDNMVFTMTYIYGVPGFTGHGVFADGTISAGFPGECCFYHLEATSGWYQPAGTAYSPGTIFGLHQSPEPVLNGTPLVWCTSLGIWNTPNSPADIISSASTVSTVNTTRVVRLFADSTQQVNLTPLAGRNGSPITVYDYKNNAGTYHKTVVSDVADVIGSYGKYGRFLSITTNGGWVRLIPSTDRTVWDVEQGTNP